MAEQETTFILCYFLEQDAGFHDLYKMKLETLKQEVIQKTAARPESGLMNMRLEYGDLQTDGNAFSSARTSESVEVNEDFCREIGSHLAKIGDELDSKMQPGIIADFVQEMQRHLSEKDQLDVMACAIKSVCQDRTLEIQREKCILACTMLLVKKVALQAPNLFQNTFRAAVQFINQHELVHGNGWRGV